jgi:chlorite dismutase
MSGRPAPKPADDEPRDFVKYTFYRLRPEWRRLPAEARAEGRRALVAVLEAPPDGLTLRTYSLVGLKADADFLLWSIAPELQAVTHLHARVAGSPLGGYLDVTHSYLGMGRISEYVGRGPGPGEGGSGRRSATGRPYLFVYPFTKKREWYGLPFEERRRIMGEHVRIGRRYRSVDIHTGYSFGLDDAEFVLAFEADDPGTFLDLVHDLRPSEASRYTALETPIFTCVLTPPGRTLELVEGIP